MRRSAAEAIRPTTTGRSPENMLLIVMLSLCLSIKRLTYKTKMKDGKLTANVAIIDPQILLPAATYPT